MSNEVLNLNVFKTQDGLFISSPSGYRITTPYLINGKELAPTHNIRWLLLKDEVEVKTVQRPYPSRKEPECYVLKDDNLFVDGKIPKKIKYEDVDGYFDEDDCFIWRNHSQIQSLYTLVFKEIDGGYLDVEFKVNNLGSVDGSIQRPLDHKFKISGKYQSDEVEKALKDIVTYSELEQIMTPEFLLHEKPCTLPSKQFFNLIRSYVKDNIDKEQARITSDYDFCFTVRKLIAVKPYEIKREQLKANGKSYRTPKFNYSQIKNEEVTVFEMTSTNDKYRNYPVLDDITGNSLQDLYDNVKTYLDILMEKINKPIKKCDCCNGVGYMLNE